MIGFGKHVTISTNMKYVLNKGDYMEEAVQVTGTSKLPDHKIVMSESLTPQQTNTSSRICLNDTA